MGFKSGKRQKTNRHTSRQRFDVFDDFDMIELLSGELSEQVAVVVTIFKVCEEATNGTDRVGGRGEQDDGSFKVAVGQLNLRDPLEDAVGDDRVQHVLTQSCFAFL